MYKILKAETLAAKIHLMVVHAPRVASHCQPGQFIIVKMDEKGERIPLTICDYDREEGTVTIFVFEQNGKKLIYAPCDVKPFPNSRLFNDADYLIIGNTIIGNNLKNNFYLTKNNPLNLELFSFEEVLEIKAKYNIQNVVFTHLEEDWGKSYDDYLNLEKECIAVKFAYDGMTIEL